MDGSKSNKRSEQKKTRILVVIISLIIGIAGFFTVDKNNSVFAAEKGQQAGSDVSEDIRAVQELVAAFNSRDIDAVMSFFTDDAVYHNMPMQPVKGTKAVRAMIAGFIGPAEKLDWEVLTIAQSGDTVLAERIDRFVIDGKDVVLPCLGAFVMRDGKVAIWRDYFDLATWQRQNEP